ncbi:MAG: serine/threonine-protein kinase [Gemmataceae bacterium]
MSLTPPTTTRATCEHPSPTHCRAAAACGAGTQYAEELGRLLHARLRVVTLIALTPTLLFLLRELTDASHRDAAVFAVHAAVTGLIGSMAGLLWARRDLTLATLRGLDLALLLSLAAFSSFNQVRMMGRSLVYDVGENDGGLGVVQMWIETSAMSWFFLIVIYGVFIPNSWKRCAMLTGLTALLPLALTPLGAYLYGRVSGEVGEGLLDLAILMGTAWAIAVFGAYRIQSLQQEAFQARQLGQYRLGGRLGSGGMGEVYAAEHVLLRRRCAIKLIREDQTRDPSTLARFEREVQAMATLTHWNTVEVYDFGRSDDGAFYYVMEYLDGLNLDALVARHGPLPAGRAIHFLRQVCEALREAHGVGLMHRDIKPSNVMACKRGGVFDVTKLLDFGLVQQMKPSAESLKLTVAGVVLGSPPYMSPEQAMGRRDVDARSDIYSLGGVGYYLLTGQPPFPRETAMEMMLAHAYEAPSPPSRLRPDLPDDVQAVILRCLSKKPEDRYASVEELRRALDACADADAWGDELAAVWWCRVVGGDTLPPRLVAAAG